MGSYPRKLMSVLAAFKTFIVKCASGSRGGRNPSLGLGFARKILGINRKLILWPAGPGKIDEHVHRYSP